MTPTTRPHEGRRHVTYPHRLGALATFSELLLGPDEAGVFRSRGSILGVLGSGRHMLSPTGVPFLDRCRTPDGRFYDCDLIFVTTGPTRIALDGGAGTLTDVSGQRAEFTLLGTATVSTRDPFRVVAEGIGFGEAGPAFDEIVVRRLLAGIARHLGPVLESGRADPARPETIGPVVLQDGRADALDLAVLGLDTIGLDINQLRSRAGRPPAGADAGQRRAVVAHEESLPTHVSSRFGVPRIPFADTLYQMTAHVSVVGYFQGDRPAASQEQWLKDRIVTAIRAASGAWSGTVLDLPGLKDEWARYVTQAVAADIQQLHLRGRVVLEGLQIDPGDERELKRRRAQQL